MNPYESASPVEAAPGPIEKGYNFFFTFLRLALKFVLLAIGVVLGAVAMTVGFLNCGVEAFLVGLMIWLLWNQCLVMAFSPYLIAPINYLTAVGLFVLFKIFFGGNNKPADNSPRIGAMSDEHRRLIETYEKTKASLGAARPGAGYRPGPRQAYRPDQAGASAGQSADKGQPANGAGSGV